MLGIRNVLKKSISHPSLQKRCFSAEPTYYTSFFVYNPMSALKMSPMKPKLEVFGTQSVSVKPGTMLFEFVKKTGDQFDWKHKQMIALSPTEMGEVIASLESETNQLRLSREATVNNPRKVMNIQRTKDTTGASSLVFELALGVEKSITVNVTKGQYHTMKLLMEYAIPHLQGFSQAIGNNNSQASNGYSSGSSSSSSSSSYTNQPKRVGKTSNSAWPF